MPKLPTNKIKRAVKVAYIGQKYLHKILFKVNLPVWPKATEVDQTLLLALGAAVFSNKALTAEEARGVLGQMPSPPEGGLVSILLAPEKEFALTIFVKTVGEVLNFLS